MKLLTILIIVIALLGAKKTTPCFDKSNSALLKAILPFFIILHHVVKMPEFQTLGTYVVALFFFMSGYGLEYKRTGTSVYSIGEIGSRITKLITPIVVPLILYVVLRWCTEEVSFKFIVDSLRSYELILPYSWFVLTLLQLYLIFYIVNNLCQKAAVCHRFPIVIACYVSALPLLCITLYTFEIPKRGRVLSLAISCNNSLYCNSVFPAHSKYILL